MVSAGLYYKPRTNGDGYKGLIHQPRRSVPSLINGIIAICTIGLFPETGMTTADEMLYPENLPSGR